MSKDSSHTYIHLHAPHHADLFEEFTHPPSSRPSTTTTNLTTQPTYSTNTDPADPDLTHIPGHFLPFESIHLPQHLMPMNPEDEDGVVPDMHAAFGIARAMGQGMEPVVQGERSGRGALGSARVEEVWRDLGVERLVEGFGEMSVGSRGHGTGGSAGVGGGVVGTGGRVGGEGASGVRREGRRGGILSVR